MDDHLSRRWRSGAPPVASRLTENEQLETFVQEHKSREHFVHIPYAGPVKLTPVAPSPLLVLDFDGTVCVGDGPVRVYAKAAGDLLDDVRARTLLRELDAYLAGERPHSPYGDGYALVADLGGRFLTDAQVDACYRLSREWLADHPREISAPPGLASLLDEMTGRVRRVLVTNSPADSAESTIAELGLAEGIDEIIGSAAKPSGFPKILDTLRGRRPAWECMSVGDFWVNDIEPALARGWCTAWLNPLGLDPRAAHLHGTVLAGIRAGLLEWSRSPISFASRYRARP